MTKARDLANAASAFDVVSATELEYIDGVTSAVQTQLDSKLASTTAATTYLPNSLADAKGDVIVASADNTFARLAVGSNDTVLTADSSTATGLKWSAPASGGMTLLSTTSLSGNSVNLTSIPQTYNNLVLVILGFQPPSQHYQAIDLLNSGSSIGGYNLYTLDTISTTNTVTNGSGKFYTTRPTAPGWLASNNNTSQSVITIHNYTRANTKKLINSYTAYFDDNGNRRSASSFADSFGYSIVDGINISTGLNGSFTGTAYLYGVK